LPLAAGGLEWLPREGRMIPTLCIANQKGGVGKTTTATCLAHALALAGRRVLVIDVDPQANATSGMGLAPLPASPAFVAGALPAAIAEDCWPGVSAVPAGHDLEALAARGLPSPFVLKTNLQKIPQGRFDVILIDCPPSLGLLTQNAVAASTAIIIPIQCEYYPLEGLVQLLGAVQQMVTINPDLKVGGILLTMVDPKVELSREVEAEVRSKLTERVFKAVIPRDTAVAEAPSHCRSVIDYAPRSPGTRGYVQLAAELIDVGLIGGKPV
jgi:chromosome partitioning protein